MDCIDYPSPTAARALVQDVVVDRGVSWERAQAMLAAAQVDAARRDEDGARRDAEEEAADAAAIKRGGSEARAAARRQRRRQRRANDPKLSSIVGFYRSTNALMTSFMLVTPKPRPEGAGADDDDRRAALAVLRVHRPKTGERQMALADLDRYKCVRWGWGEC